LQATSMADYNSMQTSMEERLKLSWNSEAELEDATLYRKLIGSLHHLVHTMPNLIFIVSYLSRFMKWPTVEDMAALKRMLRYITGTIDHGCFYQRGTGGAKLVGYSAFDDNHITSGVVFFLGTSLICWHSLKQRVVAMSSCEAKYVVATSAATQGFGWLGYLLISGRKRLSQLS
jgi:hypothetical protein